MTILELKNMIMYLPDDMNVVIPHIGDSFITACKAQSEIMGFPVEDKSAPDGFYWEETFVIRPCTCDTEDMPLTADPEPNLN